MLLLLAASCDSSPEMVARAVSHCATKAELVESGRQMVMSTCMRRYGLFRKCLDRSGLRKPRLLQQPAQLRPFIMETAPAAGTASRWTIAGPAACRWAKVFITPSPGVESASTHQMGRSKLAKHLELQHTPRGTTLSGCPSLRANSRANRKWAIAPQHHAGPTSGTTF